MSFLIHRHAPYYGSTAEAAAWLAARPRGRLRQATALLYERWPPRFDSLGHQGLRTLHGRDLVRFIHATSRPRVSICLRFLTDTLHGLHLPEGRSLGLSCTGTRRKVLRHLPPSIGSRKSRLRFGSSTERTASLCACLLASRGVQRTIGAVARPCDLAPAG